MRGQVWIDLLFLRVHMKQIGCIKIRALGFNFSGGNGFLHFHLIALCACLSAAQHIIICVASTGFPSLYSAMSDAGENLPRII